MSDPLSELSNFDPVVPVLPSAAEPILMPVPAGAVKVLPRWAEEDEVLRWRLRFREHEHGEPNRVGWSVDDGKPWTELELRPFTRELPLTGLNPGRSHYFKVAIETPDGWSNWSHTVACEPPSPELPGKPAAVYAVVQDASTILVRWTRPIDFAAAVSCGHIRRYKLRVTWKAMPGEVQEACEREIIIDDDADCCEVSDLQYERDYQFQVAAENVSGWGPLSDVSPVTNVPSPVPPIMAPPTMRRATHHSCVIQWQHPPAPDVPLESFRFRYSSSGDFESKDVQEVRDVPATATSHVIESLHPGTMYWFQCTSLNRYGMGLWSPNSLPITTLEAAAPSKIEGLSAPHVYRSFLTLQWPPPCDNGMEIVRHHLRFSYREDMSEPVDMDPVVQRKNGFDQTDLRHLRKLRYFFQVACSNLKGMSEWSKPLEVDLVQHPALEAS